MARSRRHRQPEAATGEVEVRIEDIAVQSAAEPLPFPVNAEADYPEDMRLKYRFLDLRREPRARQHHAPRAVIAA